MNSRLKELRNALNLSQEEMGKKIGLTKATVSLIESNKRSLTGRVISDVCREFNANEAWIRTGDGEMFMSLDNEFAKLSAQISKSDNAVIKELIPLLWKLNIAELEAIKTLTKSLVENK